MAKKYKVYADTQFLGHYYNTDALGAIEKAIRANVEYRPEIKDASVFSAQKSTLHQKYLYSWDNLPWLAAEVA